MAKKPANTNPTEAAASKKKARIIANSQYPEFKEEFERTKAQYLKHYPGGVEFVEARGYEELEKAFGQVAPDEDLVMMAHFNKDAMYGVPVADPNFRTFDAPEGKTLATLFSGLEKRGYQGNCYLGICQGEETAKDIQATGVNIPMFSTPANKKWFGSNPSAKGDFDDFFFGVAGEKVKKNGEETYNTSVVNDPQLGQHYKMNISPRQQELMDRRKSGTPVTEVTPLKMDLGGVIQKLGGAEGIVGTATGLIQGLQMLGNEKKNKASTEQLLALSQVVSQAAGLRPEQQRRQYVRPEDMIIDPNQVAPSYGTGTNFLAKNGAKLPEYNPGGIITQIAGEGNEGNLGSLLGNLTGGGQGQQTGAGKIGSTIGGVAGSFLGPVGGAVGSFVGGAIGGVIGGNAQKQQEREQQQAYTTLQSAAFSQGMMGLHGQNSAFMENGGVMEAGGELQVYKGSAQPISHNPFLPDAGETVMFNGPSHENGGMPIKFGKTLVEVEGGEPAVKLPDGGKDNLVVFGDMKIPSYGVSELNDPKAKGKKFKSYIKELSEVEAKQNKMVDKGIKLINETEAVDSFDKLKLSSGKAMVEGGNMKLKEIADKKKIAAGIQNAILQTADELGLKSDELAKGKIKKARKGITLKANDGVNTDPGKDSVTKTDAVPRFGVSGTFGIRNMHPWATLVGNSIADSLDEHVDFNSVYRDKAHNKKVGGTENSFHIKGAGIDVNPTTWKKLPENKKQQIINEYGVQVVDEGDHIHLEPISNDILNNFVAAQPEFNLPENTLLNSFQQGLAKKLGSFGSQSQPTIPVIGGESPVTTGVAGAGTPPSTPPNAPDKEAEKRKFDWASIVNSVLPYARPSNQMALDPNQLSGEMFALASNQLEPVQAQTYSPLLESVSDISLQDQLNANQADFNALKRLTASNPAAQATLAGQKYAANSAVLGEQFRLNQAQKTATQNRNRATLNDATLKNLAILDQQYVRQSQAKSATKATAQAALSSIAEKIAKNKLENKTLSIYENLYNYRFAPNGQAINVNPLAQFNIPQVGSLATASNDEKKMTFREWETIKKDALGMPTGKTEGKMTTTKNRNGGIVKAIKNL